MKYPFHRIYVSRYNRKIVIPLIQKYSSGKLLDIGCGEKPFSNHLSETVTEYIGVDHPDTPHAKEYIDFFSTAYHLPFENNSFDSALCTQVIEHLENPVDALKEINRILKKEGKLILSWPFLYPIHEAPRDFFRYTHLGMNHLVDQAGFKIIEKITAAGFWNTFYLFLSLYIFGKSKLLYALLSPILLVVKLICDILEWMDNNPNSHNKWTWNYCFILKKYKHIND